MCFSGQNVNSKQGFAIRLRLLLLQFISFTDAMCGTSQSVSAQSPGRVLACGLVRADGTTQSLRKLLVEGMLRELGACGRRGSQRGAGSRRAAFYPHTRIPVYRFRMAQLCVVCGRPAVGQCSLCRHLAEKCRLIMPDGLGTTHDKQRITHRHDLNSQLCEVRVLLQRVSYQHNLLGICSCPCSVRVESQ